MEDPRLDSMKLFVHHHHTTRFLHVLNVTRKAMEWAYRLPFKFDMASLITGGMLHDYYGYDQHDKLHGPHRFHWFRHPRSALRNAERDFVLNKKEKDIIVHHMWPLTLFSLPHSKEAWLICLADTHVGLLEGLWNFKRSERRRRRRFKRGIKKMRKA